MTEGQRKLSTTRKGIWTKLAPEDSGNTNVLALGVIDSLGLKLLGSLFRMWFGVQGHQLGEISHTQGHHCSLDTLLRDHVPSLFTADFEPASGAQSLLFCALVPTSPRRKAGRGFTVLYILHEPCGFLHKVVAARFSSSAF